MKTYPSILRFPCEFSAHVFDKLDGSNLRFTYSKKRGWYKFGTRHRMFDDTDDQFAEAIPLFYNTLADPIAKIAQKKHWDKVTVFAEFWGDNSFAGLHNESDEKHLTLFDASPHKKGILPPKDFRKLFEGIVETPRYLGIHKWNSALIDSIRANALEGITFEGVIGKGLVKNKLVMAKGKTQMWIDKVKELHAKNADDIINS